MQKVIHLNAKKTPMEQEIVQHLSFALVSHQPRLAAYKWGGRPIVTTKKCGCERGGGGGGGLKGQALNIQKGDHIIARP